MGREAGHPGSIDRRGDSYRIRLSIYGERHSFTLPGVSRGEAADFARTKYRELKKRGRAAVRLHMSELLDRFESEVLPTLTEGTRRSYRDSLKPIRTYFVRAQDDPLSTRIGADDVRRFLVWRQHHGPHGKLRKKPLSGRTLQKDRAVLHRIFAIGVKDEVLSSNPVSKVDVPKSDDRDPVLLTDDQLDRLLQETKSRPMLHTYTVVLADAGLRCESEALWLRWSDLDLEEGFLWVDSGKDEHRTKGGSGRWVPLTTRLRTTLRGHAEQFRDATYHGRMSPWVFHHTRRRRNAKPGDRIGSLRRSFASACERAGLPEEFTQHDLRHRRVTTWLAEGKNPVHVKEALGHSDLRVTMGYTHLVRENLRSLVE